MEDKEKYFFLLDLPVSRSSSFIPVQYESTKSTPIQTTQSSSSPLVSLTIPSSEGSNDPLIGLTVPTVPSSIESDPFAVPSLVQLTVIILLHQYH